MGGAWGKGMGGKRELGLLGNENMLAWLVEPWLAMCRQRRLVATVVRDSVGMLVDVSVRYYLGT